MLALLPSYGLLPFGEGAEGELGLLDSTTVVCGLLAASWSEIILPVIASLAIDDLLVAFAI